MSVGGKFSSQLLNEPTRKDALLDLLFVNREELMGNVMGGGCLGHSDHKMVVLQICRVMRKKKRGGEQFLPQTSEEGKLLIYSGSSKRAGQSLRATF